MAISRLPDDRARTRDTLIRHFARGFLEGVGTESWRTYPLGPFPHKINRCRVWLGRLRRARVCVCVCVCARGEPNHRDGSYNRTTTEVGIGRACLRESPPPPPPPPSSPVTAFHTRTGCPKIKFIFFDMRADTYKKR